MTTLLPNEILDIEEYVHSLMSVPVILTQLSNTALTQNDWTILDFDSEISDDDDLHDSITNKSRITVASDGVYTFYGLVLTNNVNNGDRGVAIYINGVREFEVINDGNPVASGWGKALSLPILLTAGDYVEMAVYTNSSSITTIAAKTIFSLKKG